jgi:hypothetical protein
LSSLSSPFCYSCRLPWLHTQLNTHKDKRKKERKNKERRRKTKERRKINNNEKITKNEKEIKSEKGEGEREEKEKVGGKWVGM